MTVKWPWPAVTLAGAGMIETVARGSEGALLVWHPSRSVASSNAPNETPVFTPTPPLYFSEQ